MYFICFTWNIAYFEVNIEIYYIYFNIITHIYR